MGPGPSVAGAPSVAVTCLTALADAHEYHERAVDALLRLCVQHAHCINAQVRLLPVAVHVYAAVWLVILFKAVVTCIFKAVVITCIFKAVVIARIFKAVVIARIFKAVVACISRAEKEALLAIATRFTPPS